MILEFLAQHVFTEGFGVLFGIFGVVGFIVIAAWFASGGQQTIDNWSRSRTEHKKLRTQQKHELQMLKLKQRHELQLAGKLNDTAGLMFVDKNLGGDLVGRLKALEKIQKSAVE